MLRHRLLDLIPDALWGRGIDWYWPRREAEFAVLSASIQPGTGAVDVGTWWGPWTMAMARHAKQVHSFEPQPQLARALAKRAPANVTVHQVAVSDVAGEAQLWMPKASRGLDALASIRQDRSSIELDREGSIEEVRVETALLDSFDLRDISFVKVDVEGHEAEVIRGATDTLARERPTVLVEIEQRHHEGPIEETFELLAQLGYHGWFMRNQRWQPLNAFDVARDQTALLDDLNSDSYINNFLFRISDTPPV